MVQTWEYHPAANLHFSLTQLQRSKENHSPHFDVCQPFSIYCSLGMQVRGTVNRNYMSSFKVKSVCFAQAFKSSQVQIFKCVLSLSSQQTGRIQCILLPFLGILSKGLKFCKKHVSFLLQFLVGAGMDHELLLTNSPPILYSWCSGLNPEADFVIILLCIVSISSFQIHQLSLVCLFIYLHPSSFS